ncbi:MAG: hypothetical protein ACOH5I_08730 [Oligoflexus sp.]
MKIQDKRLSLKLIVLLFLCISCGSSKSGRSGSQQIIDSANAMANKTISVSSPVEPNEQCPHGGQVIKTGIASGSAENPEEFLEVLHELLICNQADESKQIAQINDVNMSTKAEKPGENCPNGGLAIYQGDELVGYLCHGESGNDGRDGDYMLLKSESINPGIDSECVFGGKRLSWGLDQGEMNNALDPEEVIDSMLVCEPEPAICGGTYEAKNNADVAELATCFTTITGNVSFNGEDITDLSPLRYLQTVRGNFLFQSSSLTSLNGLENLKYVGGDLIFQDDSNKNLASFEALAKLEEVVGFFYVGNIAGPSDFSQLSSIQKIGKLGIHDQAPITSFNGLQNLNKLKMDKLGKSLITLNGLNNLVELDATDFSFGAGGNENIRDLSPLGNLQTLGSLKIYYGAQISNSDLQFLSKVKTLGDVYIAGSIPINDLSSLSPSTLTGSFELVGMGSVTGLETFFANITSIPGNLRINNQQSISNLNFLRPLREVGLSLTIQNNPNISNFEGLENLYRIGYRRNSNTGNAFNILNGPTTMCGLTSLNSINGDIYANDGFFSDWRARLAVPQARCD